MLKRLLSLVLFSLVMLVAYGNAPNYVLQLDSKSSVDCGEFSSMSSAESFTVQLWLKATDWASGSYIFSVGDCFSLRLGSEPSVIFTCGDRRTTIGHPDIKEGRWTQLSIICDKGYGVALVNGEKVDLGYVGTIPEGFGTLTLGGGFIGCIDELRLWNTALPDSFDYFINNTLNRLCPSVEYLVAYYKFDSRDCPDIVEQTAIWSGHGGVNNHGRPNGNARLVESDNDAMNYRVCGAYIRSEDVPEGFICPERCMLNNLFILGALTSTSDGSIEMVADGVDRQLAELRAAYSELSGYEIVLSVRGHAGWESTFAKSANRKKFAEQLKTVSEGADGVELDFEWTFGTQIVLGMLAEEVRKALPVEKRLYVAEHSDAYNFPTAKMGNVNNFTFRQDGVQKYYTSYPTYTGSIAAFRTYGFKPASIITSYTSISSHGYSGSSVTQPSRPVSGLIQDADGDNAIVEDAVYHFNSPAQVYQRACYSRDNGLGGIFCSNLSGDFSAEHSLSLNRYASYGINSNVEPAISSVDIRHSGVENISENNSVQIKGRDIIAPCAVRIEVYTFDGKLLIRNLTGYADASGFASGIYIVDATFANGERKIMKFLCR